MQTKLMEKPKQNSILQKRFYYLAMLSGVFLGAYYVMDYPSVFAVQLQEVFFLLSV